MSKYHEALRQASAREQNALLEAPASQAVATRTPPSPSSLEDLGVDVFKAVGILIRRRLWICGCTLVMLLLAGVACMLTTPQYRAQSQLQLLNQGMGRLSLGESNGGGDGLDSYAALQTYINVMRSDTLAWQTIKELNLADQKEFRYNPLVKTAKAQREIAAPLETAPLKRAAILKRFKSHLFVDAVPGTRLITVAYTDPDPQLAARIVNQLVSDFVEYNFQVDYNATTRATEFLSQQLVDLKAQVEKSQAHAVELQKASGIFGSDEHHNVVLTRLERLNADLTTAQANRVVKETVYHLARDGDPEKIAALLGSSAGSNSGGARDSLTLIATLRQQEAELKAQYAEAATKYGTANPRLIEMQERLASIHASIKAELDKLVERAKSEYELAFSQEVAASKIFAEQKAIAAKMNDQAIDYTIAQHEAESNRALYDQLLRKLKEAGVLAGLRSTDLNTVDPAEVPGQPFKPSVLRYLGVGVFAGLAFGVVGAFAREAMDRSMRSPDAIENTTEMPILGIIPIAASHRFLPGKGWLHAFAPPTRNCAGNDAELLTVQDDAVAEAFRWVRTSLLLQRGQAGARVVLVASAIPGEGKTFASFRLATALAENGSKVLLVDADLRRATLSHMLKQQSGAGLSELLTGPLGASPYRQVEGIQGLKFLPAGARPNSPAELLGSQAMASAIQNWRAEFDYVVIDTPAILPVTDAVILSRHADGVVLIARFAFTQRQSILRAIRVLRSVDTTCLGIVLNAMDVQSPEHYQYCGLYSYDYYRDSGSEHLLPARSSRRRN